MVERNDLHSVDLLFAIAELEPRDVDEPGWIDVFPILANEMLHGITPMQLNELVNDARDAGLLEVHDIGAPTPVMRVRITHAGRRRMRAAP